MTKCSRPELVETAALWVRQRRSEWNGRPNEEKVRNYAIGCRINGG